jgi:glycosyltransferase involved in cell wall biosynthesis
VIDVLIVSLGSTGGLRAVDDELLASLRRAGARAELVRAAPPRKLRTLVLTDLAWALAARRAARAALARQDARAVIYSTTTAALLWPRPGAIRFDALAVANRPGRHGLWQRPLERARLRQASLLLPQDAGALAEVGLGKPDGVHTPIAVDVLSRQGGGVGRGGVGRKGGVFGSKREAFTTVDALVLPVPVEPSGPVGQGSAESTDSVAAATAGRERDIAAIAYVANPRKKGLDVLLAAWARAHRPGEQLCLAGVAEPDLRAQGFALPAEGVSAMGSLPPAEYRALLRRARVYACAARREDYGLAQLEALADGCLLVTVASPGPYAALPLARELDPRLVGGDLAAMLRTALDEPTPGYAERALAALEPFRRAAVDRLVSDELLPRLLA